MSAVLLFHGPGLVSRLIRWQTRSVYSHAAIELAPGSDLCIESREFQGVRFAAIDRTRCDRFEVEGMTPERWRDAIAFCERELGCGYDYRAVFRFLTRRRVPSNSRWFCSELVFAALASVDVHLLRRIPASEVSPGDLALSPLLNAA
ncbi:MAG: hypothetical protein JNK23_10555 [Opitutaceae bacterium]|nr:hypothetical protein [Opitutaceae bacterium]